MNTLSIVMINVAGLGLMAGIVWWFWLGGRGPGARVSGDGMDIRVAEGVYTPSRIEVEAGKAVRLRFRREDPSPCAKVVQFQGNDIARELPLGHVEEVEVRYDEPGEYAFSCQMNMYRGTIVVQSPPKRGEEMHDSV